MPPPSILCRCGASLQARIDYLRSATAAVNLPSHTVTCDACGLMWQVDRRDAVVQLRPGGGITVSLAQAVRDDPEIQRLLQEYIRVERLARRRAADRKRRKLGKKRKRTQ
jgi:hypothetical protein